MHPTTRRAFLLLIFAQAAHSAEEYAFRLYDRLAPARFVSELLGFERPVGFLLANAAIVLFGFWCWLALVGPGRPSARAFAWFWALLEIANGTGHLLLALAAGGYFPGAATAPLLLALGVWLAARLAREARPSGPPQ